MSYKKHIVDTMKKLYKSNYISIRDGNVSFKPKNENFFYISAGSVRKNEINEDQVIKVDFKKKDMFFRKDLDYNLKFDLNFDKNYEYLPSREIYMHSLLQTDKYYSSKDIFVVHAHPPNIISFLGINGKSSKNELNNIKEIFPEINVGKIGKNVVYHEAGSLDLAKNCFDNLINNDIIGLERHGTLSIGNDIDKIFEDIETLEYYIKATK
tara:strand:+ start:1311 stop:1940 length:630 start_codon:yes stop_codon:yes gene_type:complete